MKVLIADDEPLARALLRTLLEELPGVTVVGEAADGAEAEALAETTRPDLAFLDIDMPHRNGIHAAMALADTDTEVIFVTAHEEHAVDAFEIGALDYILKPIRRPRLLRTMERAMRRHQARGVPEQAGQPDRNAGPEGDDGIWVPVLRGVARVQFADVQRVEAARDHVYFHTAERAYLYRITMSDLATRLAGTGLVRVHRSAFIRPECVTGFRRHGKSLTLTLDDGSSVPVGSTYRTEALAAVQARR